MTAQPKLKPALMLVDGKWEASADGRFIPVENPARRQAIAEVPRASSVDVDKAVCAAAKAFTSWKNVPPRARPCLRPPSQREALRRSPGAWPGSRPG